MKVVSFSIESSTTGELLSILTLMNEIEPLVPQKQSDYRDESKVIARFKNLQY